MKSGSLRHQRCASARCLENPLPLPPGHARARACARAHARAPSRARRVPLSPDRAARRGQPATRGAAQLVPTQPPHPARRANGERSARRLSQPDTPPKRGVNSPPAPPRAHEAEQKRPNDSSHQRRPRASATHPPPPKAVRHSRPRHARAAGRRRPCARAARVSMLMVPTSWACCEDPRPDARPTPASWRNPPLPGLVHFDSNCTAQRGRARPPCSSSPPYHYDESPWAFPRSHPAARRPALLAPRSRLSFGARRVPFALSLAVPRPPAGGWYGPTLAARGPRGHPISQQGGGRERRRRITVAAAPGSRARAAGSPCLGVPHTGARPPRPVSGNHQGGAARGGARLCHP